MKRLLTFFWAFGLSHLLLGQWVQRPNNYFLNDVAVASPNVIFEVAGTTLQKSTDAGQTWTVINKQFTNYNPSQPFLYTVSNEQVYFLDGNTGFSFGGGGFTYETIARTADGGANWTLVHSQYNSQLLDMSFVSPTTGLAVGLNGHVLKTTDGGANWTVVSSGTTKNLRSVQFIDSNHAVAAGDNVVIQTSNGGATWTVVDGNYIFTSLAMTDALNGFAVTNDLKLLKTTNGGTSWGPHNSNLRQYYFKKVQFVNNLTGFVATLKGLYKTTDGGKFWSPQRVIGTKYIDIFDFNKTSYGGFVHARDSESSVNLSAYSTATLGDPLPQNEAETINLVEYPVNLCRGIYPVTLSLVNQGTNLLTSATLRWSVNNVEQTPFNWTGSVTSGDTSSVITVGSFDFNRTARDFTVKVWSENPNGQPDEYTPNDAIQQIEKFNKMVGSYVVGPGADFDTVTEPTQLLSTYGVCDDVVLSLKAGVYNEQISLAEIPNISAANTVTYQSQSGNPADVTLQFSGTVVDIRNISFLTFRGLTFKSSVNGYDAVRFLGQTGTLLFENNIVDRTGNLNNACFIISNGNTTDIVIRKNRFLGASTGISYSNVNLATPTSIIIEENSFEGQISSGIYVTQVKPDMSLRRNRFFPAASGTNVYAATSFGLSEGVYTLVNNYFNLSNGGTARLVGVSTDEIGSYHIYNNTFYINSGTYAAAVGMFGTAFVKNNIIANYGKGLAYVLSGGKPKTVDYNSIFARDGVGSISLVGGLPTASADLVSWRAATGFDLHSIYTDPQLTAGDPHIPLFSSNYVINNAGTHLTEVTDDIDGQTRNATTPDIGADEFDIPVTDIGVSFNNGKEVTCTGTRSITARVTNYGAASVSGFNITLTIDGADQSPINVPTVLAVGSYVDVSLGSFSLTNGNHTTAVRVSAAGDAIARNDTQSVQFMMGGMSGAYTIGGSGPNFSTINAALNALRAAGACGPVTFNIRPGTYTEQLVLPEFPGVSQQNPLVIQSEAHDNTTVLINPAATPVFFQGGDWITIAEVSLTTSTPFIDLLVLGGESNHNTIRSNKFIAFNTIIELHSSASASDEYNTIEDNDFMIDGYSQTTAISFEGGPHYERGNVFRRNRVNQVPFAAYLAYQENFIFSNNRIQALQGISINYSFGEYEISGNDISVNATGLVMAGCMNFGETLGMISNNFIRVTDADGSGFNASSSDNFRLINNTIKSVVPLAINLQVDPSRYGDRMEVKNNILFATAGGPALMYQQGAGIASDYNILYTNGLNLTSYSIPPLGNHQFREFRGLFQWQKYSSQDLHSLALMPRFVSSTDLHILDDVRLKGKGTAIPFNTDFDGDSRNVTTPDIGADEFVHTPVPNDAGIVRLSRPAECGEDQSMKAVIHNYGTNTLTSAEIHWSVKEGTEQQIVSWSGSLAPGTESAEIDLGPMHFAAADSFRIQAWTMLPNGVVDGELINDTTRQDRVYQQLSGGYSIGGPMAHFPNFVTAVAYLKRVGICGPVSFTLNPGAYEANIIIPAIEGSSPTNRITFMSSLLEQATIQSGSIAPLPPDNGYFMMLLDDTDYITFQDLRFRAYATQVYGMGIRGEATGVEFLNNTFENDPRQDLYNFPDAAYLKFFRGTFKDTRIDNNIFLGSMTGLYLDSNGSFTSTSITGNTLTSQGLSGIWLNGINSSTNILSNTITTSADNAVAAIRVIGNTGSLNIEKNKISGTYATGLDMQSSGSLLTGGTIVNNMISVTPIPSRYTPAIGISSVNTNGLKYLFNNIYVKGNLPYYAIGIYSKLDSSVTVQNNNFAYDGPGTGADIDALEKATAVIDYNNYWAPEPALTFRYNGKLAVIPTFAEYQTIVGVDAHSITVDPLYISTADLHATNPGLNGRGTYLPSVTTDIDGVIRNNPPDIGANEFDVPPVDAGIDVVAVPNTCIGSNDVFVSVRNFSSNLLGKTTITWEVNGVSQTPYIWTGSVVAGTVSTSFRIGSIQFSTGGNYTITARTTSPNDLTDPDASNDEKTLTGIEPSVSGIITIGGSTPDFPTITDAVNALVQSTVCGTVILNVRNGVYDEQVTIPAIPGTSDTNRIILQSESGDRSSVIIRHGATSVADNFVVKVDQADHITIRNITIEATGTEFSNGIALSGTAIQLTGNKIISPENADASTSNQKVLVSMTNTTSSSVKNNLLQGGGMGVTASLDYHADTRDSIFNNQIKNQYQYGVRVTDAFNILIAKNIITQDNKGANTYQAISSYNTQRSQTVSNRIFTYGSGISMEQMLRCFAANNFVTIKDDGVLQSSFGIRFLECSKCHISFNTILMLDTDPSSTCVDLTRPLVTYDFVVRDNLLVNRGGGLCFSITGGYTLQNPLVFEYNGISATGPKIGYPYTSVDQLASSRIGEGNFLTDPVFVSDTDLHTNTDELTGAGIGDEFVTTDIDGQSRDVQFPTVGADEFGSPRAWDVMIRDKPIDVCKIPQTFGITIKNKGYNTVTSIPITWTVNGQAMPPRTWSGYLTRGAEIVYYFVGYTAPPAQSLSINVSLGIPNNNPDQHAADNSLTFTKTFYEPVELGPDIVACPDAGAITLDAGPNFTSYAYYWGVNANQRTFTVQPPTSASDTTFHNGFRTVFVIVEDANGCKSTDGLKVSFVDISPVVTMTGSATICPGSTASLQTTSHASYSYVWKKDNVAISGATSSTFSANAAGSYTVVVSTANCSKESAPVTITLLPTVAKPSITVAGATEFCQGLSTVLTAPPGFGYLWSNGSTNQSTNVTTSGIYSVKVNDLITGCTSVSSDPVTITVNPLPVPAIAMVAPGVLGSTPGDSYRWLLNGQLIANATSQTFSPLQDGKYKVEVTTKGCSATSAEFNFALTGLEDTGSKEISLSPNPTSRYLTLAGGFSSSNSVKVKITDLNGKDVQPVDFKWHGDLMLIDLHDVAQGTYLVQVEVNGTITVKRVVVVRS